MSPPVLELAYDFGDGSPVVKSTVTNPDVVAGVDDSVQHQYQQAGTFTVTLTLRERRGSAVSRVLGTATTQVTVDPIRSQPAGSSYGGYTSGFSFPNYARSG